MNPDYWHPISNGDLTPLILCRLPAKSIIKFRCVCRRWLEITSDPSFILSHTLTNPRAPIGRFLYESQQNESYDDPYQSLLVHALPGRRRCSVAALNFIPANILGVSHDYNGDRLKPLSSCNGLVLCEGPIRSSIPYYVWNPTTKEWHGIPEPPELFIKLPGHYFDPSVTVCRHPTLHYKIVCVGEKQFRRHDPSHCILIYSSLTGAWTFGPYLYDAVLNIYRNRCGVCCGGSVHWLSSDWDDQAMSVSFEMEGECLRTTPLPISPREFKKCIKYFGSSGNRLHLILRYSYERDLLHIYELSHADSGWISLYCFNELQVSIYPSKPVCFLRCETEDFLFLSHKTEDRRLKLISYCLGEKQRLCESNYIPSGISMPVEDYKWNSAAPIFCSLFSP